MMWGDKSLTWDYLNYPDLVLYSFSNLDTKYHWKLRL